MGLISLFCCGFGKFSFGGVLGVGYGIGSVVHKYICSVHMCIHLVFVHTRLINLRLTGVIMIMDT